MIAIVLVYICEIVKMFLAGTRCNAVARVIYITIKFLFLNPMNHVFLLYLYECNMKVERLGTDRARAFHSGQGDGNFINSTVGIPSVKTLSSRWKY